MEVMNEFNSPRNVNMLLELVLERAKSMNATNEYIARVQGVFSSGLHEFNSEILFTKTRNVPIMELNKLFLSRIVSQFPKTLSILEEVVDDHDDLVVGATETKKKVTWNDFVVVENDNNEERERERDKEQVKWADKDKEQQDKEKQEEMMPTINEIVNMNNNNNDNNNDYKPVQRPLSNGFLPKNELVLMLQAVSAKMDMLCDKLEAIEKKVETLFQAKAEEAKEKEYSYLTKEDVDLIIADVD